MAGTHHKYLGILNQFFLSIMFFFHWSFAISARCCFIFTRLVSSFPWMFFSNFWILIEDCNFCVFIFAMAGQCCQNVPAENPHSIYQKSPLVPTKVSSQKSPHFAKISPLFLKIPTIFEKNPNILLKFLQFFKKIPTFCKNFPLFSKNFKNFNPHLKKMVPTEPLKIPTVGINPHFRQHCWLDYFCHKNAPKITSIHHPRIFAKNKLFTFFGKK